MSLSDSDRKRLWGRAGNICSFPGCQKVLSDPSGRPVLGREAHIKGKKPKSARYDPQQPESERESYFNYTLLCPNHHAEIDSDEELWTVETLLAMKKQHERQVEKNRHFPDLVKDLADLTEKYAAYQGPQPSAYSAADFVSKEHSQCRIRVDASLEEGVHTGIKVFPGQRLLFFARGLITYDGGKHFATPEGIICNELGVPFLYVYEGSEPKPQVLQSPTARPTREGLGRAGSLYGWIHQYHPGTAFLIGSKNEIDATEEGILYLAVNDAKGTYDDNDGEFLVDIRIIEPDEGDD